MAFGHANPVPEIIEGENARILPPLHKIPVAMNKKRTREEFDAGNPISKEQTSSGLGSCIHLILFRSHMAQMKCVKEEEESSRC